MVPPASGCGAGAAAAAAVRAGFPSWPELQALSRLCVQARPYRAGGTTIGTTDRHFDRPCQVNKGLLVLHVMECEDTAAAAGAAGGAGGESGRAAAAAVQAQPERPGDTAAAQLERLRVVEVTVARWNPNKGRLEAQVMGL